MSAARCESRPIVVGSFHEEKRKTEDCESQRGTPFRRRRATALQSAKGPFHVAGKAQTLDRADLLKARKTDRKPSRPLLTLTGHVSSLIWWLSATPAQKNLLAPRSGRSNKRA